MLGSTKNASETVSCYQCHKPLGELDGLQWTFFCKACDVVSQPAPGPGSVPATAAVSEMEKQLQQRYEQYVTDKHPYTCTATPRYGRAIHYDPKGPGPDGSSIVSVALLTLIAMLSAPTSLLGTALFLSWAGYITWSETRESKVRWEGFTRVRTAYRADRKILIDRLSQTLGRKVD